MRLFCSYVLSILDTKKQPYFKEKCVFVLNFSKTRLKLFLIFGKSEAHVLKEVVLKKACVAGTQLSDDTHIY